MGLRMGGRQGRLAQRQENQRKDSVKIKGRFVLKGVFSGVIWGLAVGGAVLTTASLVTELPAGNKPPVPPQVTAPQETQAPQETRDDASRTTADAAVVAEQAPRALAPQLEITQPVADVEPAAVPEAIDVSDDMIAPELVETTPEVSSADEAPVLPNPQSIAPQIPRVEQDLTISTQPAPVPAPVIVEDDAAASTVDIAVPQPTVTEEIAVAVPEMIVGDPVSNMPGGDSSVKVNRSVTDPVADAPQEAVEADENDAPALVKFGSPFENTEAKPLLSVVLIDDGSMGGAVPALTALPFPVTVILDPSGVDAPAKMAEYRAAGIEVGVLAALPSGATAANVEVAFEATFNAFSETVLMLDAGTGGLPNDRAVTDQAMAFLSDAGRGFISVSKGLNNSLRAAESAEVPATVIYRDLDSEGQDARVIRRFLDQAAFKARQESGVVLLARVRPDTISALILWGTANRAGQVVLAPASAVLLAQ